jgi:hypothetical protein
MLVPPTRKAPSPYAPESNNSVARYWAKVPLWSGQNVLTVGTAVHILSLPWMSINFIRTATAHTS